MSDPEPWELNWQAPPGAPQVGITPSPAPMSLPGIDLTKPLAGLDRPLDPETIRSAIAPQAAPTPTVAQPWEMNWEAPPKEEPGAYSQLMQTLDRWGISGVDPKTYRGRRADGSLRTAEDDAREYPNGPVISAPPPRSALGIFADRASDMWGEAGTGVNGWFKRGSAYDSLEEGIRMSINDGTLKTQADIDRARADGRAAIARRIQDKRERSQLRDAADPTWDPKQGWLPNVGREAMGFGGDIVGDANPTYLIGGEAVPIGRVAIPLAERFLPSALARFAPAASRVVSMGTVNAGIDAGIQAGEISDGIQTDYDPYRTMMAFALGGGLQTLGETGAAGIRALRARWKARGVDIDNVPDEQLVTGSLDGTFGERIPPDEVATILQGVGSSPDHFSTPEKAQAAAQRVVGRGNGVQGAGIGSRGAPLLEDLRVPEVPPGMDYTDMAPLPGGLEGDAPLPARRGRRGGGQQGTVDAITSQTESGGRRFNGDGSVVTSPKGARGEMQVMPETARNPGFGIRPSDGSLGDDARVGHEYLAKMQDRYGGDMEKVWAAYNAGPGAVDAAMRAHGPDWLAHMPEETRNYVGKNMSALGGGSGAVDGVNVDALAAQPLPGEAAPAGHTGASDGPSSAARVAEALGDPNVPPESLPWATGGHEEPVAPKAADEAKAPAEAAPAATDALKAPTQPDPHMLDRGAAANAAAMPPEPVVKRYEPPAPVEVVRPPVPEPTRPHVVGGNEQVVTARGRAIDTQFQVHEARDLIASSRPEFDPALQPRDRASRSSSDAQIADTANRLDPEQLHSSRQAAQGAPIVGPDRMVESGNGRTAAIQRAYELHPEKAKAYRDMIEARGLSTEGFDQPVLVRRRTTDLSPEDRQAFVREANERDTMGMSSTEQAKVDSGAMSRDTLDLYRGGGVSDAGNRDFARRWMDEVATPAERNSLMMPDGSLSSDGVRRMRSSLLAKAFDDPELVAKVVEDPDTEIRAIGSTLTDAAPAFAKIKERIAKGDLPSQYDITGKVADSAKIIARARNEGKKVGDLIRQDDMFGGRTDPTTEAVTRIMFKDPEMTKPRSAADMAEGLRYFTSEAEKHSGVDMFGGAASPERAVDILDAARKRLDAKSNGTASNVLFGETGAPHGWDAVEGFAREPSKEGIEALSKHLQDTAEVLRAEGRGDLAELAEAVSKIVDAVPVKHGPLVEGEVNLQGRDPSRVGGFVVPDKEGNVFARLTDSENAIISVHEGLHAAVALRYGALRDVMLGLHPDPAVRALNRAMVRARKAFKGDNGLVSRALENLDEFFAYGMTQPEVRDWLASHPGGTGGLWRGFVDAVRRMVGLAPKFGSLLDEVVTHGGKILHNMERERHTTGKWEGRKPDSPLFADDGEGGRTKSWGLIGDLIFDPEFRSGDSAKASAAVRETFGNPKSALGRTGDRMKAFAEVTAYSSDGALRSLSKRFNSPTIAKMADLFHAEAGKTGEAVGRTFDEAVSRQRGLFISDLNKALKPFHDNKPSLQRIRDLLTEPDNAKLRASVPEREAAAAVRDLLKRVHDYRLDAGESIGEVKDGYFPRQMRADKVFANPEAFRRAAVKLYAELDHEKALKDPDAVARRIARDEKDPMKAYAREAAEHESYEAQATAWLQRIMDGHLGIADGVEFLKPGGDANAKARTFGKEADALLRDYYETNPMVALTNYISGAIKKAEENRRFGVPGRAEFGDGPATKFGNTSRTASDERKAWVKEHGDKTQWDVMRDAIRAELRANGAQSTGVVERVLALRDNNLGKVRSSSPKVTSAVSLVHAWNQLGTLGRAVFSSLPEIAMGFVRAGPRLGFTHMASTLGEVGRMIRGAHPSDAARYADAVGAIGADNSLALLRARADDPAANVGSSKVLDQFYRKSGLEGWTRAGRTAAVKTGQKFMDVLAGDLASASARVRTRSAGYLRELGIKNPEAFAEQLLTGRPSVDALRKGDSGFEAEYATALLRFADQTVLLPSRAVKPAWASHPLGSLIFALQSYNYAFKKNVLDRVGRQTIAAFKDKDITKLGPAAGLVMLTGITALVTGVRHQLYGGNGDPDHPQSDLDYALETMDRAGLYGALSPYFNAIKGLKYRRSVSQTIQGSVLGRVSQGIDAVGSLATSNSSNTNTAERKAAGAVYDLAVKPVENAVGAGVLRGALGSSVILGTGARADGALPSDKEWFMSALAGDKQDESDPFSKEEK